MGKFLKKIKDEKLNKKYIMNTLKNTSLVLLGTLILAFGTELFLIPGGLVTGGVSGIAICFQYREVPVDPELIIAIISWSLFFIGLIFLGAKFALKTLCSTIAYPIFLVAVKALTQAVPTLVLGAPGTTLENNTAMIQLLSSIFGGVFVGAGCAVTFLGGGSTGGVDIITFILCKYIKKLKSSYSIFAIDALIVVAGFISNPAHDIATCLEGVLSAFIGSLVIDKIFQGTTKTYVAYVVTDKYQEITDEIITKVDRTTSILDIEGGYSKDHKKMLMVSFTMRQYNEVCAIVSSIDSKAFMTINRAHSINGEGFSPLK